MSKRGKRVAKTKLTITKRAVDALKPADKPWIAWDDKLTGFGVRVHLTGAKSFIVNYRTGDGGRKAPNKQVVLGRYGKIAPDQARRLAQTTLGKVAGGDDPAGERAEARAMPTLGDAFKDYMAANPNRSQTTNKLYRYQANRHLCDWLSRPLDAITRRDVEARFNRITADHGWSQANQAMSLLRSVYRRPCVDLDGLRNPVDLWLAAGGKFHRKLRRKISTPAEVLPCWRAGIEAEASNPVMRDALWFGLYTGMRLRGLCCKLGEGAMRNQGASCSPYDSALARRSCSHAMASVRAHGQRSKARSTIRASPTMPPWRANIPAWPLRSARITSKPLIVA